MLLKSLLTASAMAQALGVQADPINNGRFAAGVTSSTSSGPQTGIVSNCQNYYLVQQGDSCSTIVAAYGTFTLKQFYSWNPAVGSSCENLEAGYYVCVGVPGTPTTRPTSTSSTGGAPSPHQTGIISDCTKYYQAQSGDTCQAIAAKFKTFTVASFEKWNPAVGSGCTDLIAGDYYCIAVPGTPTTPITTTTTPKPTTTSRGPQPQESGTISTCDKYHQVQKGDTCDTVEKQYSITSTQFLDWNKSINSQCTNLDVGYYYCVGV